MARKAQRPQPLGNVTPYRNTVNNPAPPPVDPPPSLSVPTIVTSAIGYYNSGNSKIEIAVSGLGIQDGDLLVLFPARVASNSTLVPGGTWTERSYDHVGTASSIEGWSTGYWTKVAASLSSPIQIDTAAGGGVGGDPGALLIVLRNYSTSSPIHASSKTTLISDQNASPTTHPLPSIVTSTADCLLLGLSYNNSQNASGGAAGPTPTDAASIVLWYDGVDSLDGTLTGSVQNGDLMLLCAVRPGSSATITPGGSWTQIEYDTVGPNTSEGWKIGMWWKIANNEAATIAVPTAAGGAGDYPSGIIKVIRNAHATTPVHVKAKTTQVASGTSHALPQITTTSVNTLVVGFSMSNYSSYVNNGTIPAGYFQEVEQNNNYCNLLGFSKSAAIAGTQDGTVTWANANDGTAYHLAIAPTSTAGTANAVTPPTGYTLRQFQSLPGVNLALATKGAESQGTFSGNFIWANGDEGTAYHIAIGPSGSAPPPPTLAIPDEVGSMTVWYEPASQTIRANPSGTGMINGDVMVLFAASLASDSAITPGSGWTQIEYDTKTGLDSTGYRIGCWWKVANNEPNPIVIPVTLGSSGAYPAGIIKVVRGASNTSPISAKAKSINVASSTSHALPSLTTTETDTLLLALDMNTSLYSGQGATAPAGYLLETELLTNYANLAGYSKDAPTAQAYTGTVTWAVAGGGSLYHLSIKGGTSAPPPPPLPGSYYTKTYTEDTTGEWGNPHQGRIADRNSNNQFTNPWDLSQNVNTLWNAWQRVHKYDFGIADFRNAPISQGYLDAYAGWLDNLESNGFTAQVRPLYSYDIGLPDTDLNRIRQHVDQLATIIVPRKRIFTTWNMGFIGYFGEEWGTPNSTISNLVSLWNYIRSVWGDGIFVGVRRIETLQGLVTGEPNPATGFDTYIPGHYNDYRFGNASDANTYTGTSAQQTVQRNLAKATGVFFPIGGETHYIDQSPYTNGQQWNDANHEYNIMYERHFYGPTITTLGNWTLPSGETVLQSEQRRLGARIYLQQAKIPYPLVRGQTATFEFTFINRGTTNMVHPRGFELVLRNQSGGAITRLPFHNPLQGGNRPEDPRRWISTHVVTASVTIPSGQTTGTYDLGIEMPDGRGLPRNNRFNWRLANASPMWESSGGWNNLQQSVSVT